MIQDGPPKCSFAIFKTSLYSGQNETWDQEHMIHDQFVRHFSPLAFYHFQSVRTKNQKREDMVSATRRICAKYNIAWSMEAPHENIGMTDLMYSDIDVFRIYCRWI